MTARSIVGTLLVAQAVADIVVVGVLLIVGPPLLNVPFDRGAAIVPAALMAIVMMVFSAITTAMFVRRSYAAFVAIERGGEVAPDDLLAIDALPSRLALAKIFTVIAFLSSLVLPWAFEEQRVPFIAVNTALLLIIFVGGSSLPLYVAMKNTVSRALEKAPLLRMSQAVEIVERLPPNRVPRVRTRFLLAVVGPLAFVSVGAIVVVQAHLRVYEKQSVLRTERGLLSAMAFANDREIDAVVAAFPLLAKAGYSASFVEPSRKVKDGTIELREVYGEQTLAVTQDEDSFLTSVTLLYFIFASLGGVIAGVLASKLGGSFTRDLLIATRSVRSIGVADVIKGTKMVQWAQFRPVTGLLDTIDSLGDVFRQFAAAKERAIVARLSSERARGMFLASMSHDLKTPLNAILGFAELARRRVQSEDQKESLTIIEQRGRELLHLIHTILDSAKLEEGLLDFQMESADANELVKQAVSDAQELLVGSDVYVQLELQTRLPRVEVDSSRTIQGLVGIMLTAARLAVKGGVFVHATLPPSLTLEQGEKIRVDIEIAEATLPERERDKIFEAFKNAEAARRHGGLGLGLSLARAIVLKQGGDVVIESTRAGGLVFQVTLRTVQDLAPSTRRPSVRPGRF